MTTNSYELTALWKRTLARMLVGGGIGGMIQLGKQGRAAEIPRFLRHLLGAALWVIFLFGSMYLGAWLGDRLFGPVGYFIGWFTGAVFFVLLAALLICVVMYFRRVR
jgi:hypothetical protein